MFAFARIQVATIERTGEVVVAVFRGERTGTCFRTAFADVARDAVIADQIIINAQAFQIGARITIPCFTFVRGNAFPIEPIRTVQASVDGNMFTTHRSITIIGGA